MNLDLLSLALALKVLPNDDRNRATIPEPAFRPFDLDWLSTPAQNGRSDFSARSDDHGQDTPELLAA